MPGVLENQKPELPLDRKGLAVNTPSFVFTRALLLTT